MADPSWWHGALAIAAAAAFIAIFSAARAFLRQRHGELRRAVVEGREEIGRPLKSSAHNAYFRYTLCVEGAEPATAVIASYVQREKGAVVDLVYEGSRGHNFRSDLFLPALGFGLVALLAIVSAVLLLLGPF
jgi:uncharacterized membrane protein